ncbi:MAG: hypothetical protein GEU82_13075 [Luteitalea sp.]|nr:hypothetical protein [Luteitalea sp.]
MSQRSVEILIGRLMTDEQFRDQFVGDRLQAIEGFLQSGYELTETEIAALRQTSTALWAEAAEQLDPRLRKASFTR